MENARKEELAQKNWFANLKRWRGWFVAGKAELARAHIGDINDPLAVKGLTFYLGHEENRELKLLWIDALARIGGPAFEPLIVSSMEDDDEEVRII